MVKEKTEFAKALEAAGLSLKRFSEITNTPYRTTQHWTEGSRRTPGIAFAFIELWLKSK